MDDYKNVPIIDDISLPHSLRRSIWLIKDEEDGNDYTADEILDSKSQDIIFNMRSTLTAAYKSGESKYVCPFCGEPVGLKVRTNEGDFFPFFSHYQDSDDSCPLKTTNEIDPTRVVISSENRFKESVLHHDMVTKLKEILELSQSFKEIEVDRVISSPEVTGYRRPSLYSEYHGEMKICFDALVSNPQIGLLVGRNAFYKMQKMFYLWVFPDFSTKNQRMCEKDILYMNRRNVFVFDSLDYYNNEINKKHLGNIEHNHIFAYEESIRQKRLMLNCYWQVPVINEKGNPSISWKGPKLVAFDDIVLDTDNYEAYFHDSDQDFYHSYSPEKQHLIDEWMRIKEDRWKKIFDSIEKRKLLYEQALARKERRERLAYYYPLIESGEITPVAFQDEKTKLWGYRYNDFEIIPPIYYEISPFYMGYAFVKKKRYWGIIDYKGNNLSSFEYKDVRDIAIGIYSLSQKDDTKYVFIQEGTIAFYDDAQIQEKGYYKVKQNDLWGVVSNRNEIIIPIDFDYISEYRKGLISAKKMGKWGIINECGETIIPFEFDSIYDPHYEKIIRVKKYGKWGIIDAGGKIVVPFEFEDIGILTHGRAKAKKYGKWGIIDDRGIILCSFDYDRILDNANNYWEVIKYDYTRENRPIRCKNRWGGVYYKDNYWRISHEKRGIINTNGKVVVPCEYDAIYPPTNGIIRGKRNSKWGCVNEKGEIIIPFEFDYIDEFIGGKAKAQKNRCSGYINENGEEVYNFRVLSNGMIVYESLFYNKCGLMNAKKEEITGFDFSTIRNFCNGIAWAKKEDNWGCIDENGKVIIPFEFNETEDFIEGRARVQKNYKWGYINENGEELYDTFEEIGSGFFKYKSVFKDEWGIMTNTHTIVIKPEFQQIEYFSNGLAKAKKDWKWGFINEKGEVVIPFDYDELDAFVDGRAKAKKRGKWGCIDDNGKIIIPFEYDEITYSEGKYRLFMNLGYGWNWNQRKKLVKVVNFSKKERKVDISKIEPELIYIAKVSGFHKIGLFINIPEIGEALIPTKHLKQFGKSIREYKKGMQVKVQLLSINEERQQATFKLVEEST